MAKKVKVKKTLSREEQLRQSSIEWDAKLRSIAKLHYKIYDLDKEQNYIVPLDKTHSLHLTKEIFSIRILTGNAPGNGMYHYLRVRPDTKSTINLQNNKKAFSVILSTLEDLKKNNKLIWTLVGRSIATKYVVKDVKTVRPEDYVGK